MRFVLPVGLRKSCEANQLVDCLPSLGLGCTLSVLSAAEARQTWCAPLHLHTDPVNLLGMGGISAGGRSPRGFTVQVV